MSSYQVFARKYRPQTFDQVVGQEHITQTLRNAINSDRLAHAYLFVGPRGTGKTSTARILAKALNCVNGPTINPCGECVVCKEIATGNSLDVLEIDGASNNGVEQVRELRENVRFAPTRGKYKVYIIDEVHMLTTAAFNALLKTLEEPPEHVKFIFATTDVQKVLPTILSRCQRFDLRRIPAELIAGHLTYIAENEKIDLQPDAARAIAKGAEGGLRDAESMLDQLVAFCGELITEQDVLSVFGFTAAHTISTLCDALLAGDSAAALGIVHQQAEAGRDLSRLMADLIGHLRNILVAKADPEGIKAEIGGDELTILQEQAEMLALDRLLDLIEQFAAAENRMKWAPNKKLHFEIAVIKAIQTLGQATLTEVLDTLTAIRTGTEPPTSPVKPKRTITARPAPAPAPVVRHVVPTPVQQSAPVLAQAPTPTPAAAPAPAPLPVEVVTAVEEAAPTAPEPTPAPPLAVMPLPVVAAEELAPWDDRPSLLAPIAEPADTFFAPEPVAALEPAPVLAAPAPVVPEISEDPVLLMAEIAAPSAAPPEPELSIVIEEPVLIAEPEVVPSVVAEPAVIAEQALIATPEIPAAALDFATADFADFAAPVQTPHAAEPIAEPAPAAAEVDLHDLWCKIAVLVRELRKVAMIPSVDAGRLVSAVKNTYTIAFTPENNFQKENLSKPSNRKVLEELFFTVTKQSVTLVFETQSTLEMIPLILPEIKPQVVADPMEEFKNDPLIRKALDLFQAEIQTS